MCYFAGWLESIGYQIVYELQVDYRNPVLYVLPIQSIIGKTCCSLRSRHREYSVPPARLSWRTRHPLEAMFCIVLAKFQQPHDLVLRLHETGNAPMMPHLARR